MVTPLVGPSPRKIAFPGREGAFVCLSQRRRQKTSPPRRGTGEAGRLGSRSDSTQMAAALEGVGSEALSGRSDRLCLARARSGATGDERVIAMNGRALGPEVYSAIGMWRAASAGPSGPKRSVARRSPGPKGIAQLMAFRLIAVRRLE